MLVLDQVRKRYGDVQALDGLTLRARPGRLLGFLGPNGAGKTTAMRSVFGLVRLDGGTVTYDGAPVDQSVRMRFGYMPEERGLYPRMAIGPQLAHFGELHGMPRRDAERAAQHWLDELGLGDRPGDRLEALSHGNQQRVQLAAALVADPELLILDEPFSGLDPLAVDRMLEVLRERADAGVAVVFSSHQLDLVEELCEDVAIVNGGRVALAGTIDEVRHATTSRRADIGLGTAAPRWQPPDGAEVVARRNGLVRLRVPGDLDPEQLLHAAREAGDVTRFTYEPPTLSEIFREVVSA